MYVVKKSAANYLLKFFSSEIECGNNDMFYNKACRFSTFIKATVYNTRIF